MTTATHRDLGPDKRAAEMSDSDEAGHANGADLPAARGGSSRWTHSDPVDRRHQHAWVPGSAALLTWLIGLSDILAIFRPDLVHKLHKIDYLVPGTLTTVTRTADVIIGLELSDYWATVNGFVDNGLDGIGINETKIKPGTKLIGISSTPLATKSNFQDFQRFQVLDVDMVGDAEATLPALLDAVKAAIPNDRKVAMEKRGEALKKAFADSRDRTRAAAATLVRSRASSHAFLRSLPRFSIAALRSFGIAAFTASISAGRVASASPGIDTSMLWKR